MGTTVGILFVAFATSLGWALRGEWGNWWGETVPGALSGMAVWLAFGQVDNAWQMIVFGAVLALGHTVGGEISYGKIVGYVVSPKSIFDGERGHDDGRSPLFGLLALFLVGGMIGFFPATGLGLLLTDAEYSIGDLALLAVVASIGAFMAYKLLVLGLDLRLSPPRSDYWAATLGGSLGAICFFVMVKNDLLVLRTGLLGWAGYGTGFVLGGLVHRRACKGGWRVDSWKWMEHSVGFLGGLGLGISASLFQLGLGNRSWGAPACLVGFLVVFWFVPYLILSDVFQDWAFRLWLVGTARSVSLLGDDAEGGASLPPREGWRTIVSRRCFVVFQIASLASLAPFTLLVERLVVRWEGTSLYRWPFIAAMSVYVSIAIIKSLPIQRDRQKLIVHGTFLAMMTICLALLPFL